MAVIPKVNGSVKITPIAIVKPGIAPANIPAKVPTNINPNVTGSKLYLQMLVELHLSYSYQILISSPSGRITFKPKVKIDHITPIVTAEIIK